MSLSRQILVGLVAGVAVGLFFGEKVSFLDLPARGFVQLLQVTVLPYIVTSLIAGIAGGSPSQVRRLASRGGLALAVLWGLSLALVFLSPLALPADKGGSYFATTDVAAPSSIDWIDLYIPSNPFRSLANSVVPAVVVFSVLLGIAVLALPGKERILQPLAVVNDALGRAGSLLVALTPIGIFAIAGHAAGTMRLEEFARLQAFLYLYAFLSVILAFWLLPGLVAVLTGISYRRVVYLALDPLVTAFVTANLFIVLPLLAERSKTLLDEAGLDRRDTNESVDVLVPTSFTFPHSAKLLSLVFVVFAGWFAGAPVAVHELPTLAGAGLLSFFGSLNTAMPFLLDLARIPADLFQLFIVSGVVNSRFGSAAAAMHTFALALLGAHLMAGRLRVDRKRLVGFAVASVLLVGGFLLGSRALFARVLPRPEKASAAFDRLRVTGFWGHLAPVEVVPKAAPSETPPVPGQRLEEIVRRGSVRFGLSSDEVPWSFRNSGGEPVGFEADLAHAVAIALGVRLELVPVEGNDRAAALANGACDLAVGRVRTDRARLMVYSRPLAHESWAFLVPDYQRELFSSLARVQAHHGLRIAVVGVPEWRARLEALFPEAEVKPVHSIPAFVDAPEGEYDAMFTGYGRGAAFSLLYPRFSCVVPQPDLGSVPITVTVPQHEEALLEFVNSWVEEQRASGLVDARIDYWIHGKGALAERGPRWSVARDVLDWWQ
jgi:Na+/H+-dicarboxylate symporter